MLNSSSSPCVLSLLQSHEYANDIRSYYYSYLLRKELTNKTKTKTNKQTTRFNASLCVSVVVIIVLPNENVYSICFA